MKDDLLNIKISHSTQEKLELTLYTTPRNNNTDLDLYSISHLEKQLIDIVSNYKSKLPKYITLSLKPIHFIDSEGLFFCMQTYTLFQKKGSTLILSNVNSEILRIFKLTRVDQKIKVLPLIK